MTSPGTLNGLVAYDCSYEISPLGNFRKSSLSPLPVSQPLCALLSQQSPLIIALQKPSSIRPQTFRFGTKKFAMLGNIPPSQCPATEAALAYWHKCIRVDNSSKHFLLQLSRIVRRNTVSQGTPSVFALQDISGSYRHHATTLRPDLSPVP